ncbi:MAG TPA: thiamine phosphate synthase [Candidatus Sulfotelmatobacter sp.]|nr:thiamine phosphate synthase [Candidatus Sulfotelmatobacter sp.]
MPDRCLLYYITDRTAFGADEPTRRLRLLDEIAEAARGGVDYIQLREKDLPTRDLEMLARGAADVLGQLRIENREIKTALLINSRTDVALAAGADGVHLRSDDLTPQEVRAIWEKCGASAPARLSTQAPLIGVSCHSPREVKQAEDNGATFAIFGPVFEKKDVANARPAGLAQLREACKVKTPVLALGGVTVENAKFCLEAGAAGIAAIRLFQEHDIKDVVGNLVPRS